MFRYLTSTAVWLALCICCTVFTQDARGQSGEMDQIRLFQAERNSINHTAMLVLGSWAIGNIIIGTYGTSTATGQVKYFHQFNALWNTVNLGIAGFALLSMSGQDPSSMTALQVLNDHTSFQSFLLLNAGLDVAYVSFGLYLRERSKSSSNADRLHGYGNSLLLQGGFLLAFDLILYFVNDHTAAVHLYPFLEPMLTGGAGVGLRIHL
jgi:hypothetical protein